MSSDESRPGADSQLSALRNVTDARTLRALTHPVRIAIIETLSRESALTATELGERIGESPTTCSFHLRQLARYGFVEEAGGGKGRARPWKMTSIGFRISGTRGDADTELAAGALGRLLADRQFARYQAWLRTRAAYPRPWRQAAGSTESVLYLTAGELERLHDELTEVLLTRYRERLTDPGQRPPGSLPVEFLLYGYPIAPAPGTSGGGDPPPA
ncbi:MAG TPA: helix-turn-helix domain-containing protein [Streptosporangiaceae bacterium]|nr:helix-turn-helix domain-containing protein [Streptosporangiaceae bacterium]